MFGSEWVLPVRIDRHRRDAALRVNKIRFGQPTPAATSTSRSSQAAPGQPSPIVISVLRQELCAVERLRQRDEMVAREGLMSRVLKVGVERLGVGEL